MSTSPSLLYPLSAVPCTIIPVFLVNKANKDPSAPLYLFLVILTTFSALYAARGSYLALYDAAFLPSTASPLYRNLTAGGYVAQALGIGMVAVVGWQVWWAGVKEKRAKKEGLVEMEDEKTEREGGEEKEVEERSA